MFSVCFQRGSHYIFAFPCRTRLAWGGDWLAMKSQKKDKRMLQKNRKKIELEKEQSATSQFKVICELACRGNPIKVGWRSPLFSRRLNVTTNFRGG